MMFAADLLTHSPRPLQAEADPAALDPWETPISGFFVRSHFDVPIVSRTDGWEIVVDGLVEKPLKLTVAELRKAKQTSFHAVLECSGNGRGLQTPTVPGVPWRKGAVGNAGWSGVALGELLRRAGVKPEGKFVTLTGADAPTKPDVPGFVRSIPLEKALDPATLVALTMNGEALPLLHGGPARIVLPNWYGENWMKWVTKITVTDKEDAGFYMAKGYRMPKQPVKPGEAWDSATGVPVETLLVQSFMTFPRETAVVGPSLQVKGKAFSGSGKIARVVVSVDDGATWRPAEVEAAHADGGWQEFSATLDGLPAGPLTILSRAVDTAGNEQPLEHVWNPSGYLRQAVDRVTVTVAAASLADGRVVLEMKCLTCHARQLIEAQRLTTGQWEKTVEKMAKVFKVQLSEPETKALLAYVSRYSVTSSTVSPAATRYEAEALRFASTAKSGNAQHGASLFKQHCAVCHGAEAQGDQGPRLKSRTVPDLDFRAAVAGGRGIMPPFKTLAAKELDDLQAFLG